MIAASASRTETPAGLNIILSADRIDTGTEACALFGQDFHREEAGCGGRPDAQALVGPFRARIVEQAIALTGLHLQRGRSDPYRRRLDPGAGDLPATIRACPVPHGVMTPGALA